MSVGYCFGACVRRWCLWLYQTAIIDELSSLNFCSFLCDGDEEVVGAQLFGRHTPRVSRSQLVELEKSERCQQKNFTIHTGG